MPPSRMDLRMIVVEDTRRDQHQKFVARMMEEVEPSLASVNFSDPAKKAAMRFIAPL